MNDTNVLLKEVLCPDVLREAVTIAIVNVCRHALKFRNCVRIAGDLSFIIDSCEIMPITLLKTIEYEDLDVVVSHVDKIIGENNLDILSYHPVSLFTQQSQCQSSEGICIMTESQSLIKSEHHEQSSQLVSAAATSSLDLSDTISISETGRGCWGKSSILDCDKINTITNTSIKCFICDECQFTTHHEGHYKRHMARRHSDLSVTLFKCKECGKCFCSPGELKRHTYKVHDYVVFPCTVCGIKCRTAVELKKHLQIIHGIHSIQQKIACDFCSLRFLTSDLLNQHVISKHQIQCNVCGEIFTRSRMLLQHCNTVHSDTTLSCNLCSRQFSTSAALRRHKASHSTLCRRRVSCDKCDKSFTSSSTLYHHKRAIHSTVKPYRCQECSKQFNFNHSLKLHILKHAGVRPHQCTICGKSYLTASHLKYHVVAIHSDDKKFGCNICGKLFPYETSLKLHKMLHADEKPYTCSTCGKRFITRGALCGHEESHVGNNDEQRRYRCEVCSRFYRTPALLRAHSRRHTADAARHVCEVCGRTFMYRSNLESHATVHTGERAFACSVCGKMFKTPATLYTHKIIHRTDVTAHVCTACGKPFKTRERLRAHEARHSGAKPFICGVCGGAFPDRGGLAKHVKTVHAARPRFACPSCGKTANRLDNLRVHMRTHNDPSLLTLKAIELTSGSASLNKPALTIGDSVATEVIITANNKPATLFDNVVELDGGFRQSSKTSEIYH